MSLVETAGLTVFILVLFSGIFLSTLGLPGTLLIVFNVMVYAVASGFAQIGLKVILILVVMAIVAELFDFGLDMLGVVRFGMPGRGMLATLVGSLAGAVMLTPFLLGLGTLVGIFLGGGAAVLVMEMLRRRKLKPAFRAGIGDMLGRMAGISVKGGMSVAMAAFALLQIYS